MASEGLLLNRAVVLAGVLVYWGGVLVQARRVRRHIGKSVNSRPRGPKERLLWAGWLAVIAVWLAQPFVAGRGDWAVVRLFMPLVQPVVLALAAVLTVAGYAGTLWCYAAMGDVWRMGINRHERNPLVTGGPYRWVRHPIYLFQIAMLAGVILALPTPLSLLAFCLHTACVLVKVADEESYLAGVHGAAYGAYRARAGRLCPRFRRQNGKPN